MYASELNPSECNINLNYQKSWTFQSARWSYIVASTNVDNKQPQFVWENHIGLLFLQLF